MTFKKGFENVFHRKLITLSPLKREEIESIKVINHKISPKILILCSYIMKHFN